jgi:serine/threonine protein kinase
VADPGKSKGADEAAYAARIGLTIRGKWHVDALLGVGGMAAVYSASHRNGQIAALKILHIEFAKEKTICDRFLREAYVSNKVGHPATVKVLDDDMTEQGEPFLVMELLEGQTVRDVWRKAGRTMPIVQALQICERVVDCLAACHSIGVIHRDLKPANIFVTNKGEVKVLDFGVAQMRSAATERTATGTALGTPSYMSPEQARGRVDDLDGRADIFSVGAMMHALITGHRINAGKTEMEALAMAATKPVSSIARIAPNLPVEVIHIVDKALQFDRRNRFSDARDMQAAMLEALANQGASPLAGIGGEPLGTPAAASPLAMSPLPPQTQPAAPAQRAPELASRPVTSPISRPPRPSEARARPEPTPPPQAAGGRGTGSVSIGARANPQSSPSAAGRAAGTPSPAAVSNQWQAIELDGPVRAQAPQPQGPGMQAPQHGNGQPIPIAVPPGGGGMQYQQRGGTGVGAAYVQQQSAEEADPRLIALRDLMKHMDRLLPSVRQFGWTHPATERTMRTLYQAYADALTKDAEIFAFTLRPYSFLTSGQTAWEPNPPFDSIPYNLFACGIRELKFLPGIAYEELRDTIAIMLLDPSADLPPEDDLVAALWEKNFSHVKYECCDAFVEGEAAEREAFFDEADAIEGVAAEAAHGHASRVEARAMAVATDARARSALREDSPLAVDEVVKNVLMAELALTTERWSERFVDALVEGYIDSAMNRDAPLVLASLRKSCSDLVVAERLDVVTGLYQALVEQIQSRIANREDARKLVFALTNAMFGGDTFELLLRFLTKHPETAGSVEAAFMVLSRNELRVALAAARAPLPPELRGTILRYIERVVPGQESEILQAVQGIGSDEAYALLSVLARVRSPEALHILGELQNAEDVDLRISAKMLLSSSPEQAEQEVAQLLDHPSALARLAALRTILRYRLKGAWPTIARVVQKLPPGLGSDEKLELMRALVAVDPNRGEGIAIEIAKKGGIVQSEERETARTSACVALGEQSSSRAALMAMNEVSQSRWGTSQETRDAAANAVRDITARLEGGARS